MENEKDIELDEEAMPAEDNESSDEFDYDEDGNIIIPDVVEELEEDPEDDGSEADDADEADDSEEPPEEPEKEDSEEPHEDKDDTSNPLQEKYDILTAQVKDTLSKLGVQYDDEDIVGGLVKVAAEAADKTPEEYAREREEARKLEEGKKLLERKEFEEVKKADTAELKAKFPELKGCEDIEKEPWFIKFATFRSKGLTAEEAYSAANPTGIRKSVAASVKRQNLNDTKSHLRSNVPKGGKVNDFYMSNDELRMAREALPGMSDEEIIKIYKKI